MSEFFESSAIHQSEYYKQAIKHIKDRKAGLITSFKTPWEKLNNETLDGFEWKTDYTFSSPFKSKHPV
jgi:hypothetical protein